MLMLLPNLHYSSRFYLFSHDEKGQSSSLPESLAWDEWRLPVADARVCLDKLHLTLTVFRENKNTTTRNLLSPLSDLVLAQRARQRKEPVRVECEQSCPAEQKPSYSRLEDCQQDEGGT